MNFFAKTCSFHGDRCHEEKRKKKKPIKQLQEGKPHHHATALNQRAGTEPGEDKASTGRSRWPHEGGMEWVSASPNCVPPQMPPDRILIWDAWMTTTTTTMPTAHLCCIYIYSWPPISIGCTSLDSTNRKFKIFPKFSPVLNMYRPFFLSLFPKQYSLRTIYIVFCMVLTIICNLEMI